MRGLTEKQSLLYAKIGIAVIIATTYVLIYQKPTIDISDTNQIQKQTPPPLVKLQTENSELAHRVIENHLTPSSKILQTNQSGEIMHQVELAINDAALKFHGRPLTASEQDELMTLIDNFTQITAAAYTRKEQGLQPYTPKTQLQFMTLITSGDEKFRETIGISMSGIMASLGEERLFQLVTHSE